MLPLSISPVSYCAREFSRIECGNIDLLGHYYCRGNMGGQILCQYHSGYSDSSYHIFSMIFSTADAVINSYCLLFIAVVLCFINGMTCCNTGILLCSA